MKILINGVCGRMGSELLKIVESGYCGAQFAAGVDINAKGGGFYTALEDVKEPADCMIDFSHHSCTPAILKYAVEKNLPVVIATTGHTPEELQVMEAAAQKIPVFHSANMSLGVALLLELAKTAAKTIPDADIEIIETHHNRKEDAPSGTALMIAKALQKVREKAKLVFGRYGSAKREKGEIGIHAVRLGNIVGKHEVILATDTQTLTISHECHTRSVFAEGAVNAAAFLIGKPAGMYDMQSMIDNG